MDGIVEDLICYVGRPGQRQASGKQQSEVDSLFESFRHNCFFADGSSHRHHVKLQKVGDFIGYYGALLRADRL